MARSHRLTTRWLSAVAVASLLVGCTTTGGYILRPGNIAALTTQVAAERRAAIWQAAIWVLLDEGFVPDVLNESACYIGAKRRTDNALTPRQLFGATAIVTISSEGVLRVEVGGTGIYNSTAEIENDMKAVQDRLVQQILARSAVPANGPSAPERTPS